MPATVSALVSTYNSERFLRGCLDDLMAQTLWAQGRLEIIVINAGSKQYEHRILREYLARGVDLKIITSLREPLYASWNRGIRLATGDYLTSANTDDRHRPDALEVLANVLDANPDTALAYGDCYVTPTANARWDGEWARNTEPPYETGRLDWPPFDPHLLTRQCFVGPQPVWRRAVHDEIGLFDPNFLVAGDYEFWLRMTAHGMFMRRVDEVLGLFYWHPSQLGRAAMEQSQMESRLAVQRWRDRIMDTWQRLQA